MNKKPEPKDFGYIERNDFDDDQSGWVYPEGEDKYYEALVEWEKNNKEAK